MTLLHDNSRLHGATPVKTYLKTFKWEALPHPLYSPDIAPSDYHLFCSMAHGLAQQLFHSYEDSKKRVDSWIVPKDIVFAMRNSSVVRKLGKGRASDGLYFEWYIVYHIL